MLGLILSSLLALTPAQEDDPPPAPPPTEEQVEQAVAALEQALERALDGADTAPLLEAVKAAQAVPHEDVAEVLGKVAVEFELPDAPAAALDALGRLTHESGCTELLRIHRKHAKKLEDRPEWAVELYRSLGRTGDARAIEPIGKGALTGRELTVDRARILALGKIRAVEALETLVALYNRVRPNEVNKYANQIRASFAALTGERLEGGRDELARWWNDHKRNLELPEEEPPIEAKQLRAIWSQFWGTRDEGERGGAGR